MQCMFVAVEGGEAGEVEVLKRACNLCCDSTSSPIGTRGKVGLVQEPLHHVPAQCSFPKTFPIERPLFTSNSDIFCGKYSRCRYGIL